MARMIALTLLLSLVGLTPARAAIDFNSTPTAARPGALDFGSDGGLAGSIPLTSIMGPGSTLAIADGSIAISFTGPTASGAGFTYQGGDFAILGTLPGNSSPQVLLSGTFLPGAQLQFLGTPSVPDLWFMPPAAFTGTLSPVLAALFGEAVDQRGTAMLIFFAHAPGDDATLSGAQFHFGLGSTSVPEPASLAMVGIGLAAVALARCRRHR